MATDRPARRSPATRTPAACARWQWHRCRATGRRRWLGLMAELDPAGGLLGGGGVAKSSYAFWIGHDCSLDPSATLFAGSQLVAPSSTGNKANTVTGNLQF
jgi:hypothetical protein